MAKVFRQMYNSIVDMPTKLAMQNAELKLIELDTRLTDVERRLKVGGL